MAVPDNWYETFFAGINCEMWEKAATPEWTADEAQFLADVLNLAPGSSLLDIPCGMGRHSLAMARLGHRITGVDISDEYVAKVRDRARSEKLPVEVIHGNILFIPLPQRFDGAWCMGNSFGYFDFDGVNKFVAKVAAALKPGARFVINSGMLAESVLAKILKVETFTVGDIHMEIDNRYVPDEGYMESHIQYTRNGSREKHAFKHYIFTLVEVKRMLSGVGMKVIACYNSTNKQPYRLGDQQIYMVAEKI